MNGKPLLWPFQASVSTALCCMAWSMPSQSSKIFMHEVLWDYLHQIVLVYINDILVYSHSIPEQEVTGVTEVLKKLREFNLILKAEKCQFHQSEIEFLYYNISQDGVSMDERKVDAIHNWSIPTILFFFH